MFKNIIVFVALFFISAHTLAMVKPVESSNAGAYSSFTGTVINSDLGYAGPGPCRLSNYKSVSYLTALGHCPHDFVLGSLISTTNSFWLNPKKMFGAHITDNWAPGNEAEFIYQTGNLGRQNTVYSIELDVVLFWNSHKYLGENRSQSEPVTGEYVFNVGEVISRGLFIQAFNAHGNTHGYLVEFIAYEFISGPLGSRLYFRLIE